MYDITTVCLYNICTTKVSERRPSHTEGSGCQSMAWSIPPLSGYKLNTLGMQQTYLKLMYKEVIIIEMHQNNTTKNQPYKFTKLYSLPLEHNSF